MTPAINYAKKAGVIFQLHEYEHDPGARSYGLEAAEKLRVPPERVFKTLVAEVDAQELVVGIVPVAMTLNLKALASVLEAKRAVVAPIDAAERATGYVAGGISPIAQRKRHRTILDESASLFATIFVSAGRRGLEIEMAPADLMALCHARLGSIATK